MRLVRLIRTCRSRLAIPSLIIASTACRDGSPPPASVATIASDSASPAAIRVPLPGDGPWDHVVASSETRQLYIAHDAHIDVLDLDNQTLVAVLDSLPDVHGVALDIGAHRGYTSNGGDSSITVFDTRSLRALRRIHLKNDAPDGIVFDPASRRVFAMHSSTPALSVIDVGPDTVRTSVALGGSPDGGIPDGHGRLFVALKDRSELLVLDTHRLTIEHRWPLAPCAGPDAIAIDTLRARIILGCDSGTTVSVETATGAIHRGFAIGPRVDGVSIAGEMVLASTADGVVTIGRCRQDRCVIEGTIRTMRGSRTSALDERTMRLFVPYDVRLSPANIALVQSSTKGSSDGFGVQIVSIRRSR